MISDEASRAITIISGIDTCKQADAGFWRGMVTRIVLDLDEAGDADGVRMASAVLADMWNKLPDKAGQAREAATAAGAEETDAQDTDAVRA